MRHLVVAGAGIGGLATALALARDGEHVTVLERRPTLAEFGAGIQLAPNATRILALLGLLDPLRAVATEPEAVRIRRGRDGAELTRLPLGQAAQARYGAPFLLLHRPDLQRILAEALTSTPAKVRFRAEVGDISSAPGAQRPQITAGGDSWPADGFIDARGGRALATGAPRQTAWRALLPADDVAAADRLPHSNLWLGRAAHLVHYPVRAGTLVNVVAITDARSRALAPAGDPWSRPGDVDELRRAFGGWHPDALRLLDPRADWRCWPLFDARSGAAWSDGPITRVGDAAHPMLPFLAQGASQAIEDAAALTDALRSHANVAAAFTAYEQRRRPRALRVQAASRRQGEIYHLARPAADARDLAMRMLGGTGALGRLDWLYGRT